MPFLLLLGFVLAGCGREDVRVYQIPKENPPTQVAGLPPGHPPMGQEQDRRGGLPTLDWKLPEGWEQVQAGEMRLASFRIKGGDKAADVGIFPLPGMAGSDLDNVNRWRGQVGQPPVTQEELAKLAEPVDVDGSKAQVYEQAGANSGSGEKTRILAAILRREGIAWFFKMTGDDKLVEAQKPSFVRFLSSVKFSTPVKAELPAAHPPVDGSAPQAAVAGDASGPKPEWQVPAGWQAAAAGQFLAAKFNISGENDSQATVNVSVSAGDGGGWSANVNRWRQQLGLNQLTETDLAGSTTSLDSSTGNITLVDFSGTDARTGRKARLVGAMASRAGRTWFYKLMGDERVVEREKDPFVKFVQTTKYPNAA